MRAAAARGRGDGGGGEGDGGGGLGDGELALQQVFLHFLRCFAFVHLLTFLHFFSFAERQRGRPNPQS